MRSSHLRWLLPLAVLLVLMSLVLVIHRAESYRDLAYEKQNEIALDVLEDMRQRDMDIAKSQAAVETASNLMIHMRADDNRSQIVTILDNMVADGYVDFCAVFDEDGKGYDNDGRDLVLSSQPYAELLTDNFSSGGIGLIADEESLSRRQVYVAGGVRFVNKNRGYIIASIPVKGFSDQLFGSKYIVDLAVVIDMNGRLISEEGGMNTYADIRDGTILDRLPSGLTKDTVKLAFSQKINILTEIPDYGYAVIVPHTTVLGGALILITDSQMKAMTSRGLNRENMLILLTLVASVLFVILVFAANILGDYIIKKNREKRNQELDKDPVTGLLTGGAFSGEITRFITETNNPSGMLFIIRVVSMAEDYEGGGASKLDEKKKEFGRLLLGSFRSTDIIGYLGGADYAVFLKDIREDKNIRKQTDELQMFLHDIQDGGEGYEVYGNAGIALCPDKGLSADALTNAAKDALLRAVGLGKSKLSF
jgi:GGDEF domain-containing protein